MLLIRTPVILVLCFYEWNYTLQIYSISERPLLQLKTLLFHACGELGRMLLLSWRSEFSYILIYKNNLQRLKGKCRLILAVQNRSNLFTLYSSNKVK